MKARENEMQFLFVLSDLILLNFSFLSLYLIFQFKFFQPIDIYLVHLVGNFSWVLAHLFIRKQILFSNRRFRVRFYRLIKRLGVFILIVGLMFVPLEPLIGHAWYYLLAACVTFAFLKLGANYIYYRILRYKYKSSSYTKRSLLVGTNDTMQRVRKILKANPILRYRVVGVLADKGDENPGETEVLGTFDQFEHWVKEEKIHAVFKAVQHNDDLQLCGTTADTLLQTCNRLGVRLYYVPVNPQLETGDIHEEKIDGILLYNPQKIPLDIVENQVKKRIFDLVFSGLVIVFLLSWMYPLLGLIIKLSSKGPVLFTQRRTGINNVEFDCYKFRSMKPNAQADVLQASANDPRITRIGKFMRKTNIDELPQFLNVFKGDMSVVGPRPHMVAHTEQYSALISNYLVRHHVRPGITGWAQINGYRGETKELWKMEKRVDYDRFYIQQWTFDWDFVIVWKTVFALKAFNNAG
jgi:Undecaprenyl-phosphate glucose phosphotransferase